MTLSVILPFHNSASTIRLQLEALTRQRRDRRWEVIAVDNGSTDETRRIVEGYRAVLPHLRIVEASDRKGPAYARNIGAKAAEGEALAFCDADDEVDDSWVGAIGAAILKHGFVASRMDATKLSTPRALAAKGNKRQQTGLIEYTYVPYLPFAGACGLGIKKELHEQVGGFDETMEYLEDCDYCWRVQLAGTELNFAPEALVHIRHRDDPRGMYRQARNWGEYNVALLKRYQEHGMPKPPLSRGPMLWLRLLRRLPRVHRQADRDKLIWALGYRVGQVRGSFKHRMFAP